MACCTIINDCTFDHELGVFIEDQQGIVRVVVEFCETPCVAGETIELFPVYAGNEVNKAWAKIHSKGEFQDTDLVGDVFSFGDGDSDTFYGAIAMDTGTNSVNVAAFTPKLYTKPDTIKLTCLKDIDKGRLEVAVRLFSYN